MITCIIRYRIEPSKRSAFEQYARTWGQVIPRCGADLIGYFAPHEGSTTLAYGIYSIESLAAYEQYKQRLAADPVSGVRTMHLHNANVSYVARTARFSRSRPRRTLLM